MLHQVQTHGVSQNTSIDQECQSHTENVSNVFPYLIVMQFREKHSYSN